MRHQFRLRAAPPLRQRTLRRAVGLSRPPPLVDLRISEANGTAERDNALFMLVEELPRSSPVTVGADKGYDTAEFVDQCRLYGVVPHVAQNTTKRRSGIDARTTLYVAYAISQRFRKRLEEVFG